MKFGFYLQNKGIVGLDCSTPLAGNPGIGGTEYLFTAIPYAITTHLKNSDHHLVLLTDVDCKLPNKLHTVTINSNLQKTLNNEKIDYLVLRYSTENYKLVKSLAKEIKIIFWAHNFIPRKELSVLANDQQIACIVCVGNEQLQMYRDHKAFYKSVVIFNGYPVNYFVKKEANNIVPFEKRDNEVTFLGNLVDYKGFHILAKAWKEILKAIPDAHLNVIGGGKLYDRNQKLGRWNIAEKSYEDLFMPYLLDNDGHILPSVTFHGVLGNEKNEILNRTKVGVPNPSGVSETFCIAALEMQLYGAIISTINYGGFKDTVYRTGILYETPDDLAKSVISQLKKSDNDYLEVLQFLSHFDFSVVINDWIKLFDTLQQTGNVKNILKPKVSKNYRFYEYNRILKSIIPFGHVLPSSMLYKSIYNRLVK